MSIKDLLEEHGVPYTGEGAQGGREGWIQTTCPDCGDISSKGYSKFYLGISLISGASNCWRCGKKNTARVLAVLTGKSYGSVRQRVDDSHYEHKVVRKTGKLRLPRGRGELLPAHIAYLKKRGLWREDLASLWGLQGIGQDSKLGWRVFIPIYRGGEVVSWTTRSIRPKSTMRYLSASAESEAVQHKNWPTHCQSILGRPTTSSLRRATTLRRQTQTSSRSSVSNSFRANPFDL
jgi:hypothetical protein